MGRPRRRLSAELCAVTLIVMCVAGTLGTVILIHRRPPRPQPLPPQPVVVAPSTPEVAPLEPDPAKPAPLPTPEPPKVAEAPAEPPEDPTQKIVADLGHEEATQRLEAAKSEAQIGSIVQATDAARADSAKWKRGMSLIKGQLANRAGEADRKESQARLALMERDALAKRRDALKQTLKRDQERPSYAVLPHKGPNGTWQRPIVLECKDETVTLQPKGPTFELMDLALGMSSRTPPFVQTISREAVRIQRQYGPDGKDVIPYIFFIIRPSGIRAYYEARVKLERLGIAFGYELADIDWAIDFPDLDHPSTWDGSAPPVDHHAEALAGELPNASGEGNGGAGGTGGGGRASKEEIDNAFRWPKSPPGMESRGNGSGSTLSLGDGIEDGGGGGGVPGGTAGHSFGRAGGRRGGGLASNAKPGTGRGSGEGELEGDPVATGARTDRARQSACDEAWERAMNATGGNRPVGLPIGSGGKPWLRGENGQSGNLGDLSDLANGLPPGFAERAARAGGVSLKDITGGLPEGSGDDNTGQKEGSTGNGYLANAGQVEGQTGRGGSSRGGRGSTASSAGAGQSVSGNRGDDGSSGATNAGGGNSEGGEGQPGGGDASGNPTGGKPGLPGSRSAAGGMAGGLSPLGDSVRPLDLVVACGPKGVSIHPGNYRVTIALLKSKDSLLVAQLRAIVKQKEISEPDKTFAPSIRYVIEPNGTETYAKAKSQIVFSGIDWPSSMQINGGDQVRLFQTDAW